MVGVCDSKSLVVPMDVLKEELNDELLSEVCRIKSTGSSLLKLGDLGNSLALSLCSLHESVYGFLT